MDTSWLEKFLTSPGNDGRAFSGVVDVRREGEVLFQSACGLASLRWGVPNTLDMRFDVAPISKLFTSVAVPHTTRCASKHRWCWTSIRRKDRPSVGEDPGEDWDDVYKDLVAEYNLE